MKPSEWIMKKASLNPIKHGQAEEVDYIIAIMDWLNSFAKINGQK